jgi:hypothetical protein
VLVIVAHWLRKILNNDSGEVSACQSGKSPRPPAG